MKIRCNTCEYLNGRMCDINKISVSPNKSRICEHYIYIDVIKTKTKPIHTIQAPLSALGKKKIINTSKRKTKGEGSNEKVAHPLTGNLSRFIKSIATKKGD